MSSFPLMTIYCNRNAVNLAAWLPGGAVLGQPVLPKSLSPQLQGDELAPGEAPHPSWGAASSQKSQLLRVGFLMSNFFVPWSTLDIRWQGRISESKTQRGWIAAVKPTEPAGFTLTEDPAPSAVNSYLEAPAYLVLTSWEHYLPVAA